MSIPTPTVGDQAPTPQPIKAVLAMRRVSHRGLARAVGVTPQWISGVVNGRRYPSERLAAKIAYALDLPVDELFRDLPDDRRPSTCPGDETLRRVTS